MFCSTFQWGPRKFQGGRGGGLKDSLTLLNWGFKWRLIQNHNQSHNFEDNAMFSGGDAKKRNARIFEHSISERIAFPHIIMFHDYNYTFSSHLPKTTFSRSCQKPLFFTIDKSHYSRSSLEFFLRLLKAMLFPSPFFPTLFLYSFPQVTVFPRYSQVKFLTTLFTYSRSAPHTLYASNDYYRFLLA